MCNPPGQFDETFRHLTGNPPFPWQRRLYEKWVSGNFPKSCDLPTGAGKTSVVALWLIALAENPEEIPKRLVYVVNRRTVVDQTTDEVEKIAEKFANTDCRELSNLCAKLSRLSAIEFPERNPLAISTLRGQMADNRAWSADPCRPSVIIGTVDMIGSRLLFGGYRIGFKSRPLHAGFLGQDALLIHDEAHLEPAFQTLAESIVKQQKEDSQNADAACQLNLVSLTATPRNDAEESFHLESDDNNHPILSKRLHASKNLRLHPINDPKQELVDKIVEIALEHEHQGCGKLILIYARKVETVEKIVNGLIKSDKLLSKRVLSLTGTMRGLERDKLAKDPVFQRFLPEKNKTNGRVSSAGNNDQILLLSAEPPSATENEIAKSQSNSEETVYLVCTSAGEVGIDLSAKHLVCDLSSLESMAQRFGRVNRFGDPEPLPEDQQTRIDVVHPAEMEEGKSDYNSALKKTLNILKSLKKKQQHPENLYDASPHSLRETLRKISAEERQAAFSPEPEILPTSDILFDTWTMTTIKGELPGRPPLAPYLHGISEGDPPQTAVAWREEVECITGDLLQEHRPEDLLEAFPLKPHELLSDRSKRVFDHLQKIAERHPDEPVWLIDEQNHVEFLSEQGEPLKMIDLTKKERIQYKTVLLSPKVGGLSKGMLSGKTEKNDSTPLDVSWQWRDENGKLQQWTDENGQPRRKRFRGSSEDKPEGWRLVRKINLSQAEEDEVETDEEPSDRKIWYWYENPRRGDGEGYTSAKEEVSLEDHTNDVAQIAEAFAKRIKLDAEIARSLKLAARWHDLGKNREHWQRSISNPNPQNCLAKSGPKMSPMRLGTYRHEFGSLIDAEKEPEFADLSSEAKDLTLHLIAAHHGRARPHFPQKEVFDPDNPLPKAEKIADEVPLRFERLQRRYGRWGLAYLESLLRAADYAASAGLTAKKETAK